MRRWVHVALCTLACSGPTEIDLSQRSGDALFLLEVDGDGAVVRSSDVFGLDEGRLTFGEAPGFADLGAQHAVVLAELDTETLGAAAPNAQLERLTETRLTAGAPPLEPTFAALAPPFLLQVPLPEAAQLLTAADPSQPVDADAERRIRESAFLEVPVNGEPCPPPVAEFQSFLGGPLPDGVSQRLRGGRLLGEQNRALFAIEGLLVLAVRGQQLRLDARNSFELDRPYVFNDIAVRRVGTATWRVVAVGGRGIGGTAEIVEVLVTDDGFTDRRTAATQDVEVFAEVDIQEDGTVVVLDTSGRVWTAPFGGTYAVSGPLDGSQSGDDVQATRSAAIPFVASTNAGFHRYEANTERWVQAGVIVGDSINAIGTQDGTHLFGATRKGQLLEVTPSSTEIRQTTPIYPPTYAPCATPELTASWKINEVEVTDDHLYYVVDNCDALLSMRRADQCMGTHPVDGAIAQSDREVTDIHIADGRMLITGDDLLVIADLL